MDGTFLHLVAKDILGRLGGNLENCVIVFPNQRPATYLIKELERLGYSKTLPFIHSVEHFIDEYAGAASVNPVDLIVILFDLYLKHFPESDFDSFYGWGNMMLNDFDEIDRYMADPAALFKNLTAVKDLEKYFLQDESMPFEMLPELMPEDEQYLKKRFLENWEVYEKLFFELRTELSARKLAYRGMNFRKVAEGLRSGEIKTDVDKYIFIGFNAISKSEESIIQYLIDQEKALIYWDGDHYFVDNEREGSGHFIRKSMQRLHGYNPQLFGDQLLTGKKDIYLIGAPLKVGQSRSLGAEITNHFKNHAADSTCIVLADDNLISPVLHSLPEIASPVNINTTHSLKLSSLYQLFQSMANLINHYRPESHSFYHKDVIAVLSHPAIRNQNEAGWGAFIEKIRKEQLIYVSLKVLSSGLTSDEGIISDVFNLYFKEVFTVAELDEYFRDIYKNVVGDPEPEQSISDPFHIILEELSALVKSYGDMITSKMYLRLFKEKISKASDDSHTGDMESLQILGMLETRCLDFETVFMLPVNEGIIPETKQNRSYIPFDIRRNFGLPMRDEQESIYAYNFYRLLQRSKSIYLIFDSEKGSGGEEESRYIRQVEYYLPKSNPGIKIHRRYYGFPLRNIPVKEIVVQKQSLFYDVLKSKNESGFSPTFISSYFICALQFYFKYVMNIPENEEIVEDLEAKHFGTLFHNLMDDIYAGFKGEVVDSEQLKIKKAGITATMENVLHKFHGSQKDNIVTRNSILIETVKILAEQTLEADMEYAPFKIIDTEFSESKRIDFLSEGFENIKFKGIIDRIDEKDGVVRIVDYKTGRVKINYFEYNNPEEALYKDNKEAFQTLFYGMLYLNKNHDAKIKPSIMPLREVTKGYIYINAKDGLFGMNESQLFENKLKAIVHQILDPEIQITQTEDLNICRNCSYKNICMR